MTFEYAQSVTKIEEKVIKTIYNARQSILFGKDNVWVKKDNPEFDLTMLSYGSEELCELVGLYLLDLLTKESAKQNTGLCRDDGLSCFENISGPDSEKLKKKLFKVFKSNGLSITVECNLIVTDFLDVTFHLKSATYYLYRKPNNKLLYVNKHSNHFLSIINQIPSMTSNRISKNSCDKITSIKQLLIATLFLKIVNFMITSYIFQVNPSIKVKRDKLSGSVPHIVLM